jgi:hypothetical protein
LLDIVFKGHTSVVATSLFLLFFCSTSLSLSEEETFSDQQRSASQLQIHSYLLYAISSFLCACAFERHPVFWGQPLLSTLAWEKVDMESVKAKWLSYRHVL